MRGNEVVKGKRLRVYDNGGKTVDRFTVCYVDIDMRELNGHGQVSRFNGIAWSGYKASTEYDFGWTKPTREQVIARAGDFQRVTRVEVFCTETNVSRVSC
jgi:hypothetical protein